MFHVEPKQQRKGLTARQGGACRSTAGNAEPAEKILVKKSKAKSKKRRWRTKTEMLVGNIPNK
jgi:translation elongation factor EF-Ts